MPDDGYYIRTKIISVYCVILQYGLLKKMVFDMDLKL